MSSENHALQIGRQRLEAARRATLALLDVPRDRWLYQPYAKANHVLWTVGHLATTDDRFLAALAGRPPRLGTWEQIFATGSEPLPEAAAYPAQDEVLAELEGTRRDLLEWFGDQPPEVLHGEPPEPLRRFGSSVVDLMPSLAWHEGWHAGQLSTIRRALGMPRLFG